LDELQSWPADIGDETKILYTNYNYDETNSLVPKSPYIHTKESLKRR
jgi:hypothetical protein